MTTWKREELDEYDRAFNDAIHRILEAASGGKQSFGTCAAIGLRSLFGVRSLSILGMMLAASTANHRDRKGLSTLYAIFAIDT